jgi:hypothetical protein
VFVNDGSKDNTLGYYKNYVKGMKIESVFITAKRMVEKLKRLGWECCIWQKDSQYNYIGFLDADLSTNLIISIGNTPI